MYRIAIVDISYLKARMADEVANIQDGQVGKWLEEIRIRLSLGIKTNKANNSINKTTVQ